jgi:hypothetical protein
MSSNLGIESLAYKYPKLIAANEFLIIKTASDSDVCPII